MITATKSFLSQSAADLMSRDVLCVPQHMPLREAAVMLSRAHVSGAPVVDDAGRCIGVISATDFVRLAGQHATVASAVSQPKSCSFQERYLTSEGRSDYSCALPLGVCPFQRGTKDGERVTCTQPHCVCTEWQVVELEKIGEDLVMDEMTTDPVTVVQDDPIRQVARRMIDAHIHRVVVVDERHVPVGIISSIDILAAVAYAEDQPADDDLCASSPTQCLSCKG